MDLNGARYGQEWQVRHVCWDADTAETSKRVGWMAQSRGLWQAPTS